MFIPDLFIWTLWQHHLSQTEEVLVVVWFTFSWLLGFSTSFSQIHIGHLFVCLFSSLLCISVSDVSVLFHHYFWLVWDCGVSVRPMLVPTLLGLSVSFFLLSHTSTMTAISSANISFCSRATKVRSLLLLLFKYSVVGEILPSSLGFFYLMSMGLCPGRSSPVPESWDTLAMVSPSVSIHPFPAFKPFVRLKLVYFAFMDPGV